MDIEYLLLLQRFRESTGGVLTPLMERISLFSVTYLVMIPVYVYWVIDKRNGLYTLLSYYLCCGVNVLVKLTACVYRPWIRDARVVPAGYAIYTATGYSFPSGHTAAAGPIYGGLALTFRKRKKAFSLLCLVLLLLTGFSRNFLGVHTPQDVVVGMLESALVLFVTAKLISYVEKRPERENILLLLCFAFGWLGILYIARKPYPMDYADGVLLADPQKMMNDGYSCIAMLIAFPVARYIEKIWIRFTPAGQRPRGLLLGTAGLVPLFLMIRYQRPLLDSLLGTHWGHFAHSAVVVIYCVALYPWIIHMCRRRGRTRNG